MPDPMGDSAARHNFEVVLPCTSGGGDDREIYAMRHRSMMQKHRFDKQKSSKM
jgi:hypothetical protein